MVQSLKEIIQIKTYLSIINTIALASKFLNKVRAGHRPALAWFLIITFIVGMYVCVSLYATEAINN